MKLGTILAWVRRQHWFWEPMVPPAPHPSFLTTVRATTDLKPSPPAAIVPRHSFFPCKDCGKFGADVKECRFVRTDWSAFVAEFGIDPGEDVEVVVLCRECYIRRQMPSYFDE
jgi:hypothetical protein